MQSEKIITKNSKYLNYIKSKGKFNSWITRYITVERKYPIGVDVIYRISKANIIYQITHDFSSRFITINIYDISTFELYDYRIFDKKDRLCYDDFVIYFMEYIDKWLNNNY